MGKKKAKDVGNEVLSSIEELTAEDVELINKANVAGKGIFHVVYEDGNYEFLPNTKQNREKFSYILEEERR